MLTLGELAVGEFHEKHGFESARLRDIRKYGPDRDRLTNVAEGLELTAAAMLETALIAERTRGDTRLYRVHIMVEELGELALALALHNEVDAMDALADLLYVVIGTGLAMDLPVTDIFNEVHRSNMTKAVRTEDDPRMKDKGPDYSPPDLEQFIK